MQNDIFNIQNEQDFSEVALAVFKHQFQNNRVYRSFCDLINVHPSDVLKVTDIPFLPIQFFKSRKVVASKDEAQQVFTSSGTTGSITSKHFVTDINLYKESYRKGFCHFYGNIEEYTVLALLPNYLERKGSSLVYMVDEFITKSNNVESGFYLDNLEELTQKLIALDKKRAKSALNWSFFCIVRFD